jgi:preprotein translocase subunit SecG
MQVLMNLVVLVQLLAALAMIGLVLVQHGKGADMGASFGSGASGSLFGATGSANFLSRSTAVCATLFFAATLALAYFGNLRGSVGGGSSVLDRPMVAASAAAAAASAASATVEIPGAVAVPASSSAAPSSAASR